MQNHFLIIVTGYNCEQYVKPCYRSLVNQSYKNWNAVFISDGSTDNTVFQIAECKDIYREPFSDNTGAAFRRFNAIRKYGIDDDIILLLGMDDELKPNALETINQQYEQGMWMTYGNYQVNVERKTGKRNKIEITVPITPEMLAFPKEIHDARDYRKVRYRSTNPNTFRKFLFDQLKQEDFKVNGEWIKATTESPLMFACLEMCGEEKIGVINEPIYYYRMRGSQNARRRMPEGYQDMVYAEIISRPKKELYEPHLV